MATLTITNNTSEPVLVQELYAFVPASGTLVTERSRADIEGMPGFLASVASGDLSYTLTATSTEVAAGLLSGQETLANLGAPAAADTTGVHAAVQADDANAFPGPITNPDVPRNLQVAFAASWDGGDVTIVGTDQFGAAQTETIADSAGSTVAGTKIFATVTSITKETVGATTNTASVGLGDILGVPVKLTGATSNVLFADGATEAGTFDATEHSVETTTAPDGSTNFLVLVG